MKTITDADRIVERARANLSLVNGMEKEAQIAAFKRALDGAF